MNRTVDAGTSAIREEATWHPMTGRSGNDTSIYGNSRLYSTRWKVSVPRSALNTQASASPIVHDDVHFEVKWLLGRPLVVAVELWLWWWKRLVSYITRWLKYKTYRYFYFKLSFLSLVLLGKLEISYTKFEIKSRTRTSICHFRLYMPQAPLHE